MQSDWNPLPIRIPLPLARGPARCSSVSSRREAAQLSAAGHQNPQQLEVCSAGHRGSPFWIEPKGSKRRGRRRQALCGCVSRRREVFGGFRRLVITPHRGARALRRRSSWTEPTAIGASEAQDVGGTTRPRSGGSSSRATLHGAHRGRCPSRGRRSVMLQLIVFTGAGVVPRCGWRPQSHGLSPGRVGWIAELDRAPSSRSVCPK